MLNQKKKSVVKLFNFKHLYEEKCGLSVSEQYHRHQPYLSIYKLLEYLINFEMSRDECRKYLRFLGEKIILKFENLNILIPYINFTNSNPVFYNLTIKK